MSRTNGNLKPFKPGTSGNPGGRPKSAPEMRKRCRDIVDAKVIDAWEKEVVDRGDHWVKCSELLISYGYGRPKLDIELVDDGPDEMDGLSLAELQALARQSMLDEAEIRGEMAHALLTIDEKRAIARIPLPGEPGYERHQALRSQHQQAESVDNEDEDDEDDEGAPQ